MNFTAPLMYLASRPEFEGDLARLKGLQPEAGDDVLFDDGVGIFRRDLFDLHAARRRSHEHQASVGAVEHDAEIQLARDGQRLFNQQPLHFLALGTGLVRDQLHPEHLGGQLAGFFGRLGDLDAAAFAAAASVDLCFDDNAGGAVVEQRLGRVDRFFAAFDHLPARHGNAVLREDGLSLVLVYFHVCMMTASRLAPLL